MRTSLLLSRIGGLLLVTCLALTTVYSQESQNMSLISRVADGISYPVAKSGNTAYYGSGGNIIAADVSDPTNPVMLGTFMVGYWIRGFDVVGNRLYVATDMGGLHILDISTPSTPTYAT